MPTIIMKSLAIAALLTAVLWRSSLDYRVVVSFMVTVGAIAVVAQAARAQRYFWAVIFCGIATLFNPILTVGLSPPVRLAADLASLTLFAASLMILRNRPVLSMPSITDRTPGSESL